MVPEPRRKLPMFNKQLNLTRGVSRQDLCERVGRFPGLERFAGEPGKFTDYENPHEGGTMDQWDNMTYRVPKALRSPFVAVPTVAALYALVAQAGYLTTTIQGHISPIFPSAGIPPWRPY